MDFTVLAIVLVTFLTVTGLLTLSVLSSQRVKLLICLSAWAIPLALSITAVSLNLMEPVGWSWCWISPERRKLRYALAQCWWLAIIFLTICTYLFLLGFISCRCVQSASPEPSDCGRYAADKTYMRVKSADNESVPTRSLEGASPPQPAALAKLNPKESDFSEFTLPIQGLRESVEENADSNGLSIHARQHGRINSSRLRPPVPTKSGSSGPNYHNQCPKVTRTFDVSMAPGVPQMQPVAPVPSIAVNSRGPNHQRQRSKATRSNDVSARSAEAGGELDQGAQHHKRHPQGIYKKSSDAAAKHHSPSMASSGTLPQGGSGPTSPYHGECPDSAKAFNVLSMLAATHTDSSSETIPQLARGLGPHYHNQCPKVKHSFEVVTARSQEKSQSQSSLVPRKHHNQYRNGKQPTDVVASPPEVPLHHRKQQARRTDRVPPHASTAPITPTYLSPLLLRPDRCASITTTVTTPMRPPPSPTPGLPPPPWIPGAAGGSSRRRTFFLSRSTWSDSMPSTERIRRASGAGSGSGRSLELRDAPPRELLLPLVAYPLAYAVLSLPGVVQCFMEEEDARVMTVMLGTGQYVGVAHAVAFAVAEFVGRWAQRRAAAPEGAP